MLLSVGPPCSVNCELFQGAPTNFSSVRGQHLRRSDIPSHYPSWPGVLSGQEMCSTLFSGKQYNFEHHDSLGCFSGQGI